LGTTICFLLFQGCRLLLWRTIRARCSVENGFPGVCLTRGTFLCNFSLEYHIR
jgi:hypothetical protein